MKMRKTLGILLGVLFLVSLTATAVSAACDSCNWWSGCKDNCGCNNCDDSCGCKDKCNLGCNNCDDPCGCKDKCKCDCDDKCGCKKDDKDWLGNFWGWGNWGKNGCNVFNGCNGFNGWNGFNSWF
jgi:hypothetical protein